jgi:hypothetical protein
MKLRYTPPNLAAVTLDNVRISSFTVANQYDGEAFNRSGRQESISGTAILTGNPLTSSTGAIDVIRNSLNAPRGKLELQFDSNPSVWYVLVDGSDATTAGDARNGPLPNVGVTRIEGTHSAAVTFVAFSYTYFACGDNRIQQFEMEVTQSIDEAGFITVTRSGTLRVSDKNTGNNTNFPLSTSSVTPSPLPTPTNADVGRSVDLYRNLIAGAPDQRFRRTRQDYTIDPSLTTMRFTIEDRMVFRDLKYPVMMGDASFTYEKSLSGSEILGVKTFSATFEGGMFTYPDGLLRIAVEASMARIDYNKDLIQSINIQEPNLYTRNKISFTVVAKGGGGKQGDASALKPDPGVIQSMFTTLHTTGSTYYAHCYERGGWFAITGGLKWDSCNLPSEIAAVVSNPEPADEQTTLEVLEGGGPATIEDDAGNNPTTPLDDDAGIDTTDNFISHLTSTQSVDVQDTGMMYLEATGGSYQWPMQVRLPRVVITQEVQYVTVSKSTPVPWPVIDDAFVVESQSLTVNHAPPDPSGKPTFAVVARRQVVLQTSRGTNRLIREDVVPRIVYSPESIAQARGLYSQNNRIEFRQTDTSGNVTRQDAIGGS